MRFGFCPEWSIFLRVVHFCVGFTEINTRSLWRIQGASRAVFTGLPNHAWFTPHAPTHTHTKVRARSPRSERTHQGQTAHTKVRACTPRSEHAHQGQSMHTKVRACTPRSEHTHQGQSTHTKVRAHTHQGHSTHTKVRACTARSVGCVHLCSHLCVSVFTKYHNDCRWVLTPRARGVNQE